MEPKEKLFREIIKLEEKIDGHKAEIEKLKARAVKLGWAEMGPETKSLRAPSRQWWETHQPNLFQEMIKYYDPVTVKGRFKDGGYKNKLAKAIAAEIV
tara:strand:+ start:219 stop:512 length:294 start_codon:yes stop_codon:yes gene_type:complete